MPTYDYECTACGHVFERFQSITARPIRTCPSCGLKKVRRLIGTGAGIIFKGSGFYQTDYRKSPSPSEAGHGSDSTASGGSDSGDASQDGGASSASDDASSGGQTASD